MDGNTDWREAFGDSDRIIYRNVVLFVGSCFMSEEASTVYFRKFCDNICKFYGEQFLNHRQTAVKLKDIVDIYTKNGFLFAVSYIYFMTLEWNNCTLTQKYNTTTLTH